VDLSVASLPAASFRVGIDDSPDLTFSASDRLVFQKVLPGLAGGKQQQLTASVLPRSGVTAPSSHLIVVDAFRYDWRPGALPPCSHTTRAPRVLTSLIHHRPLRWRLRLASRLTVSRLRDRYGAGRRKSVQIRQVPKPGCSDLAL
jgi:hypothetical protein